MKKGDTVAIIFDLELGSGPKYIKTFFMGQLNGNVTNKLIAEFNCTPTKCVHNSFYFYVEHVKYKISCKLTLHEKITKK